MSKAIMISIRPKWVVKILNEEKTIEVRKRFPSDYVGWVYIYCTKQNAKYYIENKIYNSMINGKVVARFWCDNVKPTYHFYKEELCALSCLTNDELFKYLGYGDGYGIHITKLEIFDKPKEISEFNVSKTIKATTNLTYLKQMHCVISKPLTKAPQSWYYVEEEK